MKHSLAGGLIRGGKYVLPGVILAVIIYWARFAPVPVEGHRVDRGQIVAEVMGTGTLEARVQTVISSKISGRIDRISVDQGDRVEEGQTLLRLDDSELRQQVEIARSALAAAHASVDRVQAEQIRAQVVLDQVRRDHLRNKKLFANKSISANEIEKSEKALSVAETDVASAKAAVAEAQKNLIVAKNTLDYHTARLNDTVIKAPFDGLIVRRDREPGDVVVPGTSIFLLVSTVEMWVRAWVDETEMDRVATGQEARVIFRSEPDTPYPGQVVRLGRETDRETREFIVDVSVKSLPRNWSVGQRAEVFIRVAEKSDVVILPAAHIVRQDGMIGVFVEKEGKAVWQPLKLGLMGQEEVEILEGLRSSDRVITPTDSKRFYEGRKVRVRFP